MAQFGRSGGTGHQQTPLLVLQGTRQHMRTHAGGYQVLNLIEAPTRFPYAFLQGGKRGRSSHGLLEAEHGVVGSWGSRHAMKVVRTGPETPER